MTFHICTHPGCSGFLNRIKRDVRVTYLKSLLTNWLRRQFPQRALQVVNGLRNWDWKSRRWGFVEHAEETRGAVLFVPRLWISNKCLPLALAPKLSTTIRFSHGKEKSIYLNPALILKTHPGFKPVPSHWLHLASLSFPAVFLITPWLNPLPDAGALVFNHRLLQERPILCLYYSTIYPTLKDCSESEKGRERRHWRLFTISLIHRENFLVV